MAHFVFVFGTLKEGFPNFATNRGRRLPGTFSTEDKLPLYLVGPRHSPWLLEQPGQGHNVVGQVYEVSDAVLKNMDVLERTSESDGYSRVSIQVREKESGHALLVNAYLKAPHLLQPEAVQLGPLSEYNLEHAALYKSRAA